MKTQNTEIQEHNNIVSVTASTPSTSEVAPPPIEAEPPSEDAERRHSFIRESLERKQRADSFYRSLKPDQQTQLLRWLNEDQPLGTIVDKVSAPPPQGFGVKVHVTSLRRLRSFWRGMDEALRTEEILDTVQDMDRHCDLSQQPRIQQAISQMLHEKAFELARTHPGSEVLGEVLSSITKLAALDHKREKLLLDRQKLLRSFTNENTKHHRVDLNIIPPARPVPQPAPPTVQTEFLAIEPSSTGNVLIPAAQQPVPELTAKAQPDTPPKIPAQQARIGRNAPCPCGSGQKYKRCCFKHLDPEP